MVQSDTLLGQMDEYLTEATWLPDLYKDMTGLMVLSTLTGRKIYATHGVATYYPNLYVLLVGDSGCGKGTAVNTVAEKIVGKIIPDRVLPDEFTPEALVANLSKQPWGTVFNDEVTTILTRRDYMDSMAPTLAKLYNPLDRVRLSRKKESFEIIEPYLGLYLGVQPQLFSSILSTRSLNIGLISRLLINVVKAKPYRPSGPNSNILGASTLTSMKNYFSSLNQSKTRIRIEISEELFTMVMNYVSGKLRAVEDEASICYGRLSDNIIKLAILFHINASMKPLSLSSSPLSLTSEPLQFSGSPLQKDKYNLDALMSLMSQSSIIDAINLFEKIDPDFMSLLRLTIVSEDSRVFERYRRAVLRLVEKGHYLLKDERKWIRKKDIRRGVGISSYKGYGYIKDLQDEGIIGLEVRIGDKTYYEYTGKEVD